MDSFVDPKTNRVIVPFFAQFLRCASQAPEDKALIRTAQKFLLDGAQFTQWSCAQEEFGMSKKQFLSYCPFQTLWVELYDFKDVGSVYLKESYHEGEIEVYGIGYDLKTSSILYLDNRHLDLKKRDIITIDDPIVKCFYTTLCWITKYLQTEHIHAVKKSIKLAPSEFRRGKFIRHISEYAVIYRKQPEIKMVGTSKEHEPFQWAHRWNVRGHWRRVKGKGKDPQGEPIDGFTWVRECIKGPDDKPLLDRPRVFKNQLPPSYIEA